MLAPERAKAGDEKGKKSICCDDKKKDCSKCVKKENKEPGSKGHYTPVTPRAGNINSIPDLPAFELNSPLPLYVKNASRYGDLTSYYAYADR